MALAKQNDQFDVDLKCIGLVMWRKPFAQKSTYEPHPTVAILKAERA